MSQSLDSLLQVEKEFLAQNFTQINFVAKPVYNFLYRWILAGPSQPKYEAIKNI